MSHLCFAGFLKRVTYHESQVSARRGTEGKSEIRFVSTAEQGVHLVFISLGKVLVREAIFHPADDETSNEFERILFPRTVSASSEARDPAGHLQRGSCEQGNGVVVLAIGL